MPTLTYLLRVQPPACKRSHVSSQDFSVHQKPYKYFAAFVTRLWLKLPISPPVPRLVPQKAATCVRSVSRKWLACNWNVWLRTPCYDPSRQNSSQGQNRDRSRIHTLFSRSRAAKPQRTSRPPLSFRRNCNGMTQTALHYPQSRIRTTRESRGCSEWPVR